MDIWLTRRSHLVVIGKKYPVSLRYDKDHGFEISKTGKSRGIMGKNLVYIIYQVDSLFRLSGDVLEYMLKQFAYQHEH